MILWERRRPLPAVLAVVVVMLLLFTACIGGDDADDEAASTPDAVETTAPVEPTQPPEATPEPEIDATATVPPEPTSTAEPTATPTVTPTATPAQPTATPTITPTPTPTPLPTVDNPLGDVLPVDQVLTNFTLDYSVRFEGDGSDSAVELAIQQFALDNYHVRVDSAGQQSEAWRVGETTWVLGPGGAIVELPGLVDPNLYAPSSFLFLIPDMRHVPSATLLDENVEIEGRNTTHYELDSSEASSFFPHHQDAPGEVTGTFEVWVDHELNLIVRGQANIEWTADGGPQRMLMEYRVSGIDSTPETQPPV